MEQIKNANYENKIIESSKIFFQQTHDHFPKQFIWPKDHQSSCTEELNERIIDLKGFLQRDKDATLHAANLVKESCLKHGFFQVVNHGIDPELLMLAEKHGRAFFELPITEKLKCQKKNGSIVGYVTAHVDRFAAKLPWKELVSFEHHENGPERVVEEYFNATLGSHYKETGLIFQKVCESMRKLALELLELLEISLDVHNGINSYYKQLYDDCVSLVRCNNYPRCDKPELTYGVQPHRDPTSLTILHQDDVGGLEVFTDNKWKSVKPHPEALVINIGDTLQALTNGKYKSCLHRVMANNVKSRLSFTYFLSPRLDKQLKVPRELVERDGKQEYPDFTWGEFLNFTQKHHRADDATLDHFTKWLKTSNNSKA
ncbi:gibberellin 20 oxidase 3-like [Rutidosis leptorrhynchoides]|uniref:gibberellin 20 oxidase 3-like n=1 Tax=Rutidosis leptorrhynchoides TaxID=125765 RepID=UPI003A990EE7